MSWRIVYIEEAEEMKLYLDNLKVIKDGQEVLVPLSDIHTIIVDNPRTVVTGRLMNKLSDYHILLIFCNESHHPNVFSLGLYSHYRVYGVLKQQMQWDETIRGEMWKRIVQIKIDNQRSILEYLNKDPAVIQKLSVLSRDVENDDVHNREGHAAKLYFNTLFGDGFRRERGAVDSYNAALNWLYCTSGLCDENNCGLWLASGLWHWASQPI